MFRKNLSPAVLAADAYDRVKFRARDGALNATEMCMVFVLGTEGCLSNRIKCVGAEGTFLVGYTHIWCMCIYVVVVVEKYDLLFNM